MRFEELAIAGLLVALFGWASFSMYNGMMQEYGQDERIDSVHTMDYERIVRTSSNQTESEWDAIKASADRLILNIPVAGEVYSGIKTIGGYIGVVTRAFDTAWEMVTQLETMVSLLFQVPSFAWDVVHILFGIIVTWSIYAMIMGRRG